MYICIYTVDKYSWQIQLAATVDAHTDSMPVIIWRESEEQHINGRPFYCAERIICSLLFHGTTIAYRYWCCKSKKAFATTVTICCLATWKLHISSFISAYDYACSYTTVNQACTLGWLMADDECAFLEMHPALSYALDMQLIKVLECTPDGTLVGEICAICMSTWLLQSITSAAWPALRFSSDGFEALGNGGFADCPRSRRESSWSSQAEDHQREGAR